MVEPSARPIVDDRVGDVRIEIGDLPFAADDDFIGASARASAAWAASAFEYAHIARRAILAMSIVVLIGLAYLAASQTAP